MLKIQKKSTERIFAPKNLSAMEGFFFLKMIQECAELSN